ncbi:uncharacterized protein K489DRAFT_335577 [Dissoconium aciculare CBS 342.82]|uniref:DUF7707 domain-containing protein n=1 Tax=Dissoconium aciculare CBS 342.82 TaxID=1314786 RepID=A0A6J3M8I0_9PEZI|nr:uncharacterized protein K489DRAFT_335577 [Dissoconium aciculare CBS 342.82]KAF1824300.1 hypothetical protein K489DRAFT_335577 [Dissoconium aciculare CBS 342.82]
MHASSILVAVAAFAGFAVAQNLDGAVFNGQNYSISGPIAVPPQNLDVGYKRKICLAQTQQCPQICGGLATKNTCDDSTLAWNCSCSNGNQPNISDYEQTVPGQICRTWFINCIAAHPDDADGQSGCKALQCGTKLVRSSSVTTTASSSTNSPTTTGGSNTANGAAATTPAGTATTSTRPNAAATLAAAQNYGHIAIAGGMAALLGLAL